MLNKLCMKIILHQKATCKLFLQKFLERTQNEQK